MDDPDFVPGNPLKKTASRAFFSGESGVATVEV